jgi:AraC family transcriptional regulator
MERVTEAGAVFETDHCGRSAMHHHRHGLPFVTIVLRGAYVEVQDTVPEFCRGGTIVVHEAGEEHADRFASDTRCLNVELPRVAGATYPRGAVVLDHQALGDAVKSVVRSFYGRTHQLSDAVTTLHAVLLQHSSQPACERPQWLRYAIEEFPWAHPVPFREAAAIAGVHETHFSRAFRRHVGMTANEYRSQARVRLASKLLLTTTSSLARIALSAGFSDQSHLTRVFSRRLGLSPAGYRRTFTR